MVQFGEKFFDTCIVLRCAKIFLLLLISLRKKKKKREWLEEATARIAFEFRGFVYKNKLNALTQVPFPSPFHFSHHTSFLVL